MADRLGSLLFGTEEPTAVSGTAVSEPTREQPGEGAEALIERYSNQYGLNPNFAKAVLYQESGFDPNAQNSSSGAAGLGQFMQSTWDAVAEQMGEESGDRFDIDTSARRAVFHLADLQKKLGGEEQAAAAYKAGEGAVTAAGGVPQPKQRGGYDPHVNEETVDYVNKVMTHKQIFEGGKSVTPRKTTERGGDRLGKLLFAGGAEQAVATPTQAPQPPEKKPLTDVAAAPTIEPDKPPLAGFKRVETVPREEKKPSFREARAELHKTIMDRGKVLAEAQKRAKRGDMELPDWADPKKMSDDNRIALDYYKGMKETERGTAFASGVVGAVIPFGSKLKSGVQKQAEEEEPFAAGAGKVAGTIFATLAVGSALNNVSKLQKINQVARTVQNPALRRIAIAAGNMIPRVVAGNIVSGTQQLELLTEGEQTFGDALQRMGELSGAHAVSVLPEVFLPRNFIQPFAQALTGAAYNFLYDKSIGRKYKEEDLLLGIPKNYWVEAAVDAGFGFFDMDGEKWVQLPKKGMNVEIRPKEGSLADKLMKEMAPPHKEIPVVEPTKVETRAPKTAEELGIEKPLADVPEVKFPTAEPEVVARVQAEQEVKGTALPPETETRAEFQTGEQGEPAIEEAVAATAKNVDQQVEALAQRGAVSFGKGPEGDTDIKLPESVNKEAEQRYRAAKGIKKPPLLGRVRDSITKVKNIFTRHFPNLNPKTDGEIIDILRQYQAVPEYSKLAAMSSIRGITAGFGPKKMDIFERNLVYPDILRDIDKGLYEGKDLPFGYKNRQEVETDLKAYQDILEQNPDIKTALETRNRLLNTVTEDLVKRGQLPESVLENPNYFHHQVLEHMAVKDFASVGVSGRDVRDKRKGWQRSRIGSGKDFNTSYLESEFEVLSQMLGKIETIKTLDKLKASADISDQLKAEAKEAGVENWKDLIPEDHTLWQPKQGNVFYQVNALPDKIVNEILTAGKQITLEDIDKALAIGGKRTQWAIPERLAKTLDDFGAPRDKTVLDRGARKLMSAWKQWTLLSPIRVTRYNVNNLSGDLDIAVAYDPTILKQAPKAASDLFDYNVKKKAPTPEILKAVKKGVVDSGFAAQEVPDISKSDLFRAVTGKAPNLVGRYWNTVKDFTQYRENILRLAAYRRFNERVPKSYIKGERIYGASKKAEIDALYNKYDKTGDKDMLDDISAKLSRELIGDYGNISHAGEWIRSRLMPFYSWMEINAPRYVRMAKNLPHEGEKTGAGKRIAGVVAAKTAKKGAAFTAKAAGLYGLIQLWNHTFFPEEEEQLGESRRQQHIILGRREDGKIMSLRVQGALSDVLNWVAAEDLPADVGDVMKGKATVGEKAKEAVTEGFASKLFNALGPQFKLPVEIAAKVSTYPNITKPRPIRDRGEHVARALSLDLPYRWVRQIPTKGLADDLMSAVVYTTDPGERAYFDTKKYVNKFIEKSTEREAPKIAPTKKSSALYYYKKALRYKNSKGARKWLQEYKEQGGTLKGIQQSVKGASPLSGLKKAERAAFAKSLTPEQRKSVRRGMTWYESVYSHRGAQKK